VKCKCSTNYGSDDCSVKLSDKIVFDLGETCCDTATMKCDKIVGVAEQLSNNDELNYDLTVFLRDGKTVSRLGDKVTCRNSTLSDF
jgi:hypothetical protein